MDEEPEEEFELNEDDFLEARIDNISVSNLGFIVFLKVLGDSRVLPIFIGANEAQSIAIAYNEQIPPRPLTHDLMKNLLGMLDVEVTRVQVTSLTENTFFGRIHLKKEGIEDMEIDARPSDALALALRYKAPIFVHKDVYESASIVVKNGGENESGEAGESQQIAEESLPKHISKVEKLKERLQKALKAEHYEEAARIRDELKRFESGN